jgi:hypothetical protein
MAITEGDQPGAFAAFARQQNADYFPTHLDIEARGW